MGAWRKGVGPASGLSSSAFEWREVFLWIAIWVAGHFPQELDRLEACPTTPAIPVSEFVLNRRSVVAFFIDAISRANADNL